MFTSARIRLTAWYLCIIMLISIMFSFSLYQILTNELERGFHRITFRYHLRPKMLEPSYLIASENRIKLNLIYINFIIFVVSGIGGYILAGFTLKPIHKMIEDQNRFLADASHEFNTPLTALKSEIEVYLRFKNQSIKTANQLLRSNLEEVDNLQQLVDGLISLVHPKSQKINTFSNISLTEVIDESIKRTQKQAMQKMISINSKKGNYSIYANQQELIKVFTILLDNAIKYSPQNSKIAIETQKLDGKVKISVIDNGIGIGEKDIPYIFDRFYRVDVSRSKQNIKGYGLGLSIAKKIVEEHHGKVETKSNFGYGTTFTVSLPIYG